jgi:hypothetical protein
MGHCAIAARRVRRRGGVNLKQTDSAAAKSPDISFDPSQSLSGADWATLGTRWWKHIQYLADDSLAGRDTGSPGFDKAADYMVEQFRGAGLEPAGADGFRQAMDFNVAQLDEGHCSFEIIRKSTARALTLGEDVILRPSFSVSGEVEGEAVFVGHGLSVPGAGYDDLEGLDLKGKIAVLVTGGPPELPSAVKAHYQSMEERRRAFNRAGVKARVAIQNPRSIELPWSRIASSRFQPTMELQDPGYDASVDSAMVAQFNIDRGEQLFEESGHTLKEVLGAVDQGQRLPRFPLGIKLRMRLSMKRWEVRSQNVVAKLPGSDPKMRDECVAFSAHLDHVGVGEPIDGDRIYSGAMDNASGAASLLEIARMFHDSGTRPRRSILFVAVTGEEKGLLGSQYYATHPTVEGPIVANLNLDMFNPLFDLKYLEVQGLEESTLGDDIRAIAGPAGVEVQPDQEPEHVLFIRSDQYSFIKTGVPALAFKFSYVPGTPEEKIFKDWLRVRYHAPKDDLDQPIDRAAAARFNALLAQLAIRVADSDRRPEWRAESFFRRFSRAAGGRTN